MSLNFNRIEINCVNYEFSIELNSVIYSNFIIPVSTLTNALPKDKVEFYINNGILIEDTNKDNENDNENDNETIKSCATGDPYIITLNNKLYKMANFDGYCRLLQGNLDNKPLIINALLKTVSYEEALQAYESTINIVKNSNINFDSSNFTLEDFQKEAFFRTIYINYENESIIIDMEKLKILDNKSNFSLKLNDNITHNYLKNTKLNHTKRLNDSSLEVKLSTNTSIIISKYANLQVRTGIYIKNNKTIDNAYGPLVEPLNKENYIIPKINFNKFINQHISAKLIGVKTELFYNNYNEEFINEIEIY